MQTLPQAAHNAAQPLITHHAPKAIITSYPHAAFRMKKAPLGALFCLIVVYFSALVKVDTLPSSSVRMSLPSLVNSKVLVRL